MSGGAAMKPLADLRVMFGMNRPEPDEDTRIVVMEVDMDGEPAIVGILAVAAFVSPPDPISQIGLAMPMYALYELAILSVRYVQKRREAALAAQDAELSGSSSD